MNCTQLSILTAVLDGRRDYLGAFLAALPIDDASPFARVAGTHNGRWVVADSMASAAAPRRVGGLTGAMLMCSAVIDRAPEEWVADLLDVLGDDADRIWGHCAGWPPAAGRRPFLLAHRVRPSLAFTTWDAPVDQVRDALALHAEVTALAVRARTMTAQELDTALREVIAL